MYGVQAGMTVKVPLQVKITMTTRQKLDKHTSRLGN